MTSRWVHVLWGYPLSRRLKFSSHIFQAPPFVEMQGYPLSGNKMAASSSAPFPDIRAELAELVKKKHDQTVSCQTAYYIYVSVSGFLAL